MSKCKRSLQLGMNPSTASHRLVKDILFSFIQREGVNCYQCGKELTRDTFSIEHKTPWLDSDDPIGLFFDLSNISYSHLSCNSKAARKSNKKYFSKEEKQEAKRKSTLEFDRKEENKVKRKIRRRKRFEETGKW